MKYPVLILEIRAVALVGFWFIFVERWEQVLMKRVEGCCRLHRYTRGIHLMLTKILSIG